MGALLSRHVVFCCHIGECQTTNMAEADFVTGFRHVFENQEFQCNLYLTV